MKKPVKKPAKKKAAPKKPVKTPAKKAVKKAPVQEPAQDKPKHAGGRPTDYHPKYCEEIVTFFSKKPTKLAGEKLIAEDMPFIEAFARSIDVTHKTLLNWCDTYPEFLQAYKKAKEMQKEFLISNGLNGLYNPTFAIFTAKNITDMRDIKQVEQSGPNGGPIPVATVTMTEDRFLELARKLRDEV